jgi:metallo-beta-lactamase family protein
MIKLQFLGAAGTVTGSKHLVEADGTRVLVDCGLFQGQRELRERNWERLPVAPESIDAVVLTHAHLDHSGYLPRLLRDGFRGRVIGTPATADLAEILLADAGRLQEEEASYRNEIGATRFRPALPLFTEDEGIAAAERIQKVDFDEPFTPAPGFAATYRTAGHLLGAAHLELVVGNGGRHTRLLFSGDVGRYGAPILDDPTPIGRPDPDIVVVESTYGDRLHSTEPIGDQVERVVREAVERGGAIVVPAFSVGRTQDLMYHLTELERAGRIPRLPVYIDSPMGIAATKVYRRHPEEFDDAMEELVTGGDSPLKGGRFRFTKSRGESKAINALPGPLVIIAGSGMLTGGRVLHHLLQRLPDPRSTLLFVGYQSEGTRGRQLLDGAVSVRVFGRDVPVRARIARIDGLSGHADANELMRWLGTAEGAPERTFVVHGEPGPAAALAERMRGERGWRVSVPRHLESYELEL